MVFFAVVLILAATRVGGSNGSPASINRIPVTPVQQTAPALPVSFPKPAPSPSLLASLAKTLFGDDSDDSDDIPIANPIDDNHARVHVWTSKANGYYYCTDDSFYKTVQPGEFMSQGDALQSGYRAILGQFCN